MGVGERVRQRRLELGLSMREIASKGVSYAYISRIENGERNPSVSALRKLAPKLGVSVEWLETGKEPTRFARFEQAELVLLERALRTLDPTDRRNGLLDELRRERAGRPVSPTDESGPSASGRNGLERSKHTRPVQTSRKR